MINIHILYCTIQVGKWRFFVWVGPSIALLIACLATITNVKKGYVDYDPTHNKLFTGRHRYSGDGKDLIKIIEESDEARKK